MIGPARPAFPDAPAIRTAASPAPIAWLVPLEAGLYAFRLGLARAPVQVCAPPNQHGWVEITDGFGRAASWLGGGCDLLLVACPAGGAALVTAYPRDDGGAAPPELEIRRLDRPAALPATRLTMDRAAAAPQSARPIGLDVVAHISGRGDVRFADAPWIGRLGPGLAIEAFTLLPRDAAASGAIECKGLTVGGVETAWLAAGSSCGMRGSGMPLIGFAVRQKTGAAGAFDCEYAGYFRSGATVGPLRNGAPCRSPADDDPLEGMQLRIAARPTR